MPGQVCRIFILLKSVVLTLLWIFQFSYCILHLQRWVCLSVCLIVMLHYFCIVDYLWFSQSSLNFIEMIILDCWSENSLNSFLRLFPFSLMTFLKSHFLSLDLLFFRRIFSFCEFHKVASSLSHPRRVLYREDFPHIPCPKVLKSFTGVC